MSSPIINKEIKSSNFEEFWNNSIEHYIVFIYDFYVQLFPLEIEQSSYSFSKQLSPFIVGKLNCVKILDKNNKQQRQFCTGFDCTATALYVCLECLLTSTIPRAGERPN